MGQQIQLAWFKNVLIRNRYFLFYCVAISLLAFGFALFSAAFSIDEEVASLLVTPMKVWIHMDRWGMFFLHQMLPLHPPLPYISMGLGMAFNLATFLLCLRLWSLRPGLGKYLAAVFVLTHPTIAFTYQFNQSQYGYYLGLFLAVLGAYWYFKYSANYFVKGLLPIGCWILAMSFYQSVIFAAPAVFFVASLQSYLKKQQVRWKNILGFSLCLLAAVFLHEIISGFIRAYHGVHDRYHTIDSFYGNDIFGHFDLFFVIKEITAQLIGHRWYVGYATGFVLVISLFFLLKKIMEKSKKWVGFLLLLAALLSPFIFVILTSRIWPARTMMALPLLLGGLIYISELYWHGWIKSAGIILTGFCLFFYTASNTRLFYADHISWQNDKLLANRITNVVEEKYGDALTNTQIPMVVVGVPRNDVLAIRRREETFGVSFFEWDDSNQHRIQALFKIIGVNYFKQPSPSQILRGQTFAKQMPIWPHAGSVAMIESVLVIKLSELDTD